jgi:CubicO group peptidase (beta-lactamase class C family)
MKSSVLLRTALFAILSGPFSQLRAEQAPAEWAATRLHDLAKGESSGVAILVGRDGQILFQGGAGLADLAKKIPVTPETKFRIGSVTKQFTAAAILRLAEEKKLALTDPLAKFFPDFPRGREITLHHLLTHTSGIHSYTDKPDFLGQVAKFIEPAKLIASFQNDPSDFAPGAGFHYNNSAYFLTGEIVAQVSGKPFADYLRETFFEPLGMKDTGVFVNSAPPPGMATGYSFADDKLTPALDWDMSWAGGAGALYSTVGDLFRWNEALFGGRVINPASFKAATTANVLPPGVDGLKYGYGLVMSELHGLPAISHSGGLNGWSSDLLRLPDQHCTVVVLANALPPPPGVNPSALSRQFAEHFLADEIAKQPAPVEDKTVDPKTYAAFVGQYDYKTATLTVTVEDGHLFAQLTGQPKYEIFPKGTNEFFWKVTDAQVVFQRNEKGEVVAAQHTQNGSTFKAPKLAEPAVKLTAEQLDAFIGQYQYAPGVVLTVTREGDALFAQLTGQPKIPIFAKSSNEFEWHIVDAQVQFVKGDDGKVAKAIHHQNGNTLTAPKIK